jgi:hypothetical protein
VYERRLLLDPGQAARLGEEPVIDVEGRFHTYQYGRNSHT